MSATNIQMFLDYFSSKKQTLYYVSRPDCSSANTMYPDQTAPKEHSDLGPKCLEFWLPMREEKTIVVNVNCFEMDNKCKFSNVRHLCVTILIFLEY